MKRLLGAGVLLTLIGVSTTVSAADCRVNGGGWTHVGAGGTLNLQVPVTVRLGTDATRILLEGAMLECRFTPGQPFPTFEDYWHTIGGANRPWTPGPKFANQRNGLRINGAYLDGIPNGYMIATMRNNGVGVPIDVTPYILIRNNPSSPIDVRTGAPSGSYVWPRQTTTAAMARVSYSPTPPPTISASPRPPARSTITTPSRSILARSIRGQSAPTL